jgi:hypothetical protein
MRRYDYTSTITPVFNSQNIVFDYPLNLAEKWKIEVINSSYWFYFDNTLQLSDTNLPYSHGGIYFGGWASGDAGTFHYLFVRKYAASEPVTNVGAEM